MAEAKGHRPRHFRAMTVGLSGQRIFGRAGIRFYASASRGTRPADAAELGAAAHFIDVGVARRRAASPQRSLNACCGNAASAHGIISRLSNGLPLAEKVT